MIYTRQEIQDKYFSCVHDTMDCGIDNIELTYTLPQMGADSLDLVELVMKVEDEFEIELLDDDVYPMLECPLADHIELIIAQLQKQEKGKIVESKPINIPDVKLANFTEKLFADSFIVFKFEIEFKDRTRITVSSDRISRHLCKSDIILASVIAFFRDIDDRKAAEELVRKNIEEITGTNVAFVNSEIELINVGIWGYNSNFKELFKCNIPGPSAISIDLDKEWHDILKQGIDKK